MLYSFSISASKHCPAKSDCRALIEKPLPFCQKETMLRFFDDAYSSEGSKCDCCYSCIKRHSNDGCQECYQLIHTYFPTISKSRIKKSVASQLKEALKELFEALGVVTLLIENELDINVDDFIRDFIRMCDEIKSDTDIVNLWHVDSLVASDVYKLFIEILHDDGDDFSDSDKDDTALDTNNYEEKSETNTHESACEDTDDLESDDTDELESDDDLSD